MQHLWCVAPPSTLVSSPRCVVVYPFQAGRKLWTRYWHENTTHTRGFHAPCVRCVLHVVALCERGFACAVRGFTTAEGYLLRGGGMTGTACMKIEPPAVHSLTCN